MVTPGPPGAADSPPRGRQFWQQRVGPADEVCPNLAAEGRRGLLLEESGELRTGRPDRSRRRHGGTVLRSPGRHRTGSVEIRRGAGGIWSGSNPAASQHRSRTYPDKQAVCLSRWAQTEKADGKPRPRPRNDPGQGVGFPHPLPGAPAPIWRWVTGSPSRSGPGWWPVQPSSR
jgi:hypothetical protein